MSFLQKDAPVIEAIKEKVAPSKSAKPKKAAQLPKKLASKKDDEDKPLQQKDFVEEQDIKEYASIQGRVSTKAAPVAAPTKKAEKKDEKKEEKKEDKKVEKQPEVETQDDKKKKKKSDWVVPPKKPERKVAPKEEEATSPTSPTESKKGDRKSGDKKKGDKKFGDRKGDKKSGDKKKDAVEGEEKKEKSIYKVFKPHGADLEKAEREAEEKKEEGKATEATTEESAAAVEGEDKKEKREKRDRKERVERTDRPKRPQGPKMVAASEAYANAEDFWETTYKAPSPQPETRVSTGVQSSSSVEGEVSPVTKPSSRGRGKNTSSSPINTTSVYTGKTWQSNSPVQAEESQEAGEFPALGDKASKKKVNNSIKKKGKQDEVEAKNDHKREASSTLFEYEVEAPSDKKIKLGDEVQQTEQKTETFVLPTSL